MDGGVWPASQWWVGWSKGWSTVIHQCWRCCSRKSPYGITRGAIRMTPLCACNAFSTRQKKSIQNTKALRVGFLLINRIMQTFPVLISLVLAGSAASQQIWDIVSVGPQISFVAHTCFWSDSGKQHGIVQSSSALWLLLPLSTSSHQVRLVARTSSSTMRLNFRLLLVLEALSVSRSTVVLCLLHRLLCPIPLS